MKCTMNKEKQIGYFCFLWSPSNQTPNNKLGRIHRHSTSKTRWNEAYELSWVEGAQTLQSKKKRKEHDNLCMATN